MPRYSYNVANVIMLELLSAQIVHPGALLPFYLMTSELLKYLNEQLSVFLNVEQQK